MIYLGSEAEKVETVSRLDSKSCIFYKISDFGFWRYVLNELSYKLSNYGYYISHLSHYICSIFLTYNEIFHTHILSVFILPYKFHSLFKGIWKMSDFFFFSLSQTGNATVRQLLMRNKGCFLSLGLNQKFQWTFLLPAWQVNLESKH